MGLQVQRRVGAAQAPGERELLARARRREADRHRIREARAAVPARDQRLHLALGGRDVVDEVGGRVAVHQHLAGDDAHAARLGGGEDRVDRGGVDGRKDDRRVVPCASSASRKCAAAASAWATSAWPRLGGKGVRRQPVEQFGAEARDDVDLRAVHVGVDEAGQDEATGVVVARPALSRRVGLDGDDAGRRRRAASGRGESEPPAESTSPHAGSPLKSSRSPWMATRALASARRVVEVAERAGMACESRVYHRLTIMIRPIRFFHRSAVVEVDRAAPTRTVLDWLREDARCTGTKEGCNEGDCGACTVVIGELAAGVDSDDVVGGLRLRSANACIQFLPTLDGKALFTVESLQASTPAAGGALATEPAGLRPETALHPVQQAMVACHGSQCGFCTPGFVMSLWAMYQHHAAGGTRPSRRQIADELSGNLCRCTGYRPIVDAGERMFDLPPVPLDAAPVVAALESLRRAPPLGSVAPGGGAGFIAPRTLADFAAARLADPGARVLAGSTDIGLWVNKGFRDLPRLLYIGAVDELKRIEARAGVLSIGAAASLDDAWRALVARWPPLAEMWLRFAGVPLRHTGTMGGNVANGSPIGDSAPVLMALDASLVLRRGDAVRRVRLADFYTGYMTNVMQAGEFVQAIEVPLGSPAVVRAYKISKRFDCDISGGLRRARDRARRRRRRRRRPPGLRRHGGDGQARGARRGEADRQAVGRGERRRRAGRAGERLRSAHRHARERRLSPPGRAEPDQALLARDAARCAARAERDERVGLDGARRRRRAGVAVNRSLDPQWLRASGGRRPTRRCAARPSARPLPHESAHLQVAGGAPYVDDLPELAGTLHAALGLSPVAHGRLVAVDRERIAALPGVVAVLVAADIPGPNDCGPVVHDDPILADGVVHYLGQPVFAVIAATRELARRAAAEAKAALTIEPLAPILTPVEAHAAKSYVLPPMHLARGNARAAIAAAPHRLVDTLDVGGQEQFYLEGQISYAGAARGPRHARPLLDAASERDAASRRDLPRRAVASRPGRVPAHGRRLRRQGVAVGALRVRRRDRGAAPRPAREAAPRPRRRLPDHRPAPLLPLRVRGRLRRRRQDPRRRADDGLARRLLGRSLGPVMTRAICHFDNAVLAARRRDPRLLGAHQHAEQHRLPRLRRAAGSDRGREHSRHESRASSARTRSTSAASTSTGRARGRGAGRTQRHAVRPGRRRQHRRRAGRRARGDVALPRAPRRDRRLEPRRARSSSAASR
jgi:xanthine dehydrogenase small subunit